LGRAHAEKIWIHNRSRERAEGLKDYLSPHFPEMEVENLLSFESLKGETVDLVVNATSVGMKGGKETPMDLEILSGKTAVYDLVYSPPETEFLKKAKAMGFSATNGLGMLAAQAAFSFELWTGKKDGVRDQMLEVLKQCRL
jgi:shikimate 5-dehydrogenase